MRIAIIGRSEILYEVILRLNSEGHDVVCIVTAKEAPEYTRTGNDYRELAETIHVPFVQGAVIGDHMDFLRSASADIAISINYTGVIPQAVIDLFPLGILNAHGGDLPRYRGNACQAWAIINGEERIGLCIHKMIGDELDSGDILARDYLPIDYRTKITDVWRWMVARTPELMMEALQRLSCNPSYFLERQSKNPKDALRCYPRRPEDGRIDWSMPAITVLRLVNACNKPYAGAFCEFEGKQLIVWDAELVDDEEVYIAMPGQVTKIGSGYVQVACGTGKINLVTVDLQGNVMSPSTIIKSLRKRLS